MDIKRVKGREGMDRKVGRSRLREGIKGGRD